MWAENTSIGVGLDQLAKFAMEGGAHAIIALRISSYWIGENAWSNSRKARHTLVGTAVILGIPSD